MITCIIPAAGTSSRMGAWKLLLPISGTPLIFHTIEALLGLDLPILVVTGYRAVELESMIRRSYPAVKFVRNSTYQLGMYSSVRSGLSCIDRGSDALILPADMPLITKKHIEHILERWNSKDVLRPRCEGIPGHPVLVSSLIAQASAAAPDLQSMQQLVQRYPIAYVETKDRAYISDADTPQEYRHLLS